MKRLFVPMTALAAVLALSIPAAAVMFGGTAPPQAVPEQSSNTVALSPAGQPVRVIAMPRDEAAKDTSARQAVIAPESTQMASEPVEIKEMAAPVTVRTPRIRKVAAHSSPPRAAPMKLGSLY